MPLAAQAPSAAAGRRQRVLAAWLAPLRERPGAWPDPWVAEQLRAYLVGGEAPDGLPALVAQSLALHAKCEEDFRRLERAGGRGTQSLFQAQAELMLDLGLGMALLRDLHHAVEGAVREGGARQARDLTRFCHDLRRAVTDIRQRIAEAEQQRAEVLSDDLSDLPREAAPAPAEPRLQQLADQAGVAHERERLSKLRARALQAAAAALPSRTETLVALLAIAVATWLVVVILPRMAARPAPTIALGDLPVVDSITAVEALAPSLYVLVDAAGWSALDLELRDKLVRGVASVSVARGFTGAVVRTEDHRTVARWLAARGVEMVDAEERPREGPRHAVTWVEGEESSAEDEPPAESPVLEPAISEPAAPPDR